MERYEVRLSKPSWKRLRARASKCTDVRLAARYRIIVLSAEGWSRPRIVAAVGWNVASITEDARTGRLIWAEGAKKNSGLFIALLKKLLRRYADKRVVHVILDNFKIHKSKQVWAWMKEFGERIRLHFLPPYSPDDNRIEAAVWTPMHKAVTYNHTHGRIDDLVADVKAWLIRTDRTALYGVAESRKAV